MRLLLLVLFGLSLCGCTDKPATAPGTETPAGQLVVTVTTTTDSDNANLDPDGYLVKVDSGEPKPLAINAGISFDGLSAGAHQVTLSGLSDNCTSTGTLAATVTVPAGESTSAVFQIICRAKPSIIGTIAFVSERDGNQEIYIINGDGTGLKNLTNHPDDDFDPAWSPDGTKIAFVSTRTGETGVYVMNADGSHVIPVAPTYLGVTQPAWSADGKQIVFSAQLIGQVVIAAVPSTGSTKPERLGFEAGLNTGPSWSPDGKTLLFSSDSRAYDFLYDIYAFTPGSDPVPILYGPFFGPFVYYFEPAWSPDGKSFAVTKCARTYEPCTPSSFVSVAGKDGSNPRDLVQTAGYARPSWSPDGNFIAYSYTPCFTCTRTAELRWVSADGLARGLITTQGYSPSWKR